MAGGGQVFRVLLVCSTLFCWLVLYFTEIHLSTSLGLALIAGLCIALTGTFFIHTRIFKPLENFRKHLLKLSGKEAELPGKIMSDLETGLSELNHKHKSEVEKLREIETFRREFLGNVSHELKTPIFAIQGFIDTLLEGAMEDPKVNTVFLEKALKHADRLDNLVKDLLIISQLETGQLQMSMEDFRLYDLVLEVFEALEYKLTRKGRSVSMKFLPHGNTHMFVHADRERIRQVLTNLIDNAIKYGDPSGTVTVEILNQNGQKALVLVANQGKGIDPEHLPRLFERFYRVDKSRSREKGGTGLGLAIAKHLIEAHREKISVESDLEKGSIFTFTLMRAD